MRNAQCSQNLKEEYIFFNFLVISFDACESKCPQNRWVIRDIVMFAVFDRDLGHLSNLNISFSHAKYLNIASFALKEKGRKIP